MYILIFVEETKGEYSESVEYHWLFLSNCTSVSHSRLLLDIQSTEAIMANYTEVQAIDSIDWHRVGLICHVNFCVEVCFKILSLAVIFVCVAMWNPFLCPIQIFVGLILYAGFNFVVAGMQCIDTPSKYCKNYYRWII